MKHYSAIFLDWDDTIGDFHLAARRALQEIYVKYNLSDFYSSFDDYYAVYHAHNVDLWDRYGRNEIKKEYLQLDRFLFPLTNAQAGNCSVESLTRIAREIGNDFLRLTSKYFRLLDDAETVVRTLARYYPLTIVSNGFGEVQYEKIRLSGLEDCFAYVILSEEVGVQKPNPLIFEKALKLNNLPPEQVLMIGDSYNSDIQGAINAGIDQLWLTTDITDPRPSTYRITSLIQTLELLDIKI